MAHTFTTHTAFSYSYTALFARNVLELDTLVFSTQTFPILNRPKYSSAKKTVSFWLKCSVIDGLRFLYLAK